jgi:hypothetical protein
MERPSPHNVRRFMGKVVLRRLLAYAECWWWEGYRDSQGYGQFKLEGRAVWAHRVAYRIFVGELGEGMEVDHTCGNPSCVNPDHLRLVDPGVNRAQRWSSNGQSTNGQRTVNGEGEAAHPDFVDGIPV